MICDIESNHQKHEAIWQSIIDYNKNKTNIKDIIFKALMKHENLLSQSLVKFDNKRSVLIEEEKKGLYTIYEYGGVGSLPVEMEKNMTGDAVNVILKSVSKKPSLENQGNFNENKTDITDLVFTGSAKGPFTASAIVKFDNGYFACVEKLEGRYGYQLIEYSKENSASSCWKKELSSSEVTNALIVLSQRPKLED